MTTTQGEARYYEVTEQLKALEGERVRLTFHDNPLMQQVGVVSTKDYGHCVDVMIDRHGGQPYEYVTRIERMGPNGRYVEV